MLIFPGIGDRIVVLATGLVIVLGLAVIINKMRVKQEKAGNTHVK